ncbi:MAG: IPT/TIG domain-containing protein, partial [Pseudonocardia sp.]
MKRALAGVIAATSLVALAGTASATPPGINGGIAYTSDRDNSLGNVFSQTSPATTPFKVTTRPEQEGDPAWSPDGTRIAYASTRSGNWDIWVADANGQNAVQFTTDMSTDREPAWSPDGTRIAWTSDRVGSNTNIFSARLDRSGVIQHTVDGGTDEQPDWSPDGTRIAFRGGRTMGDIYTVSASGTEVDLRQITTDPGNEPTWSPDGSRIAFSAQRGNTVTDIWSLSSGGTELDPRRHTTEVAGGSAKQPAWSPDGSRIAFASFRGNSDWDIYSVLSTGGPENQLQAWTTTANPIDETEPHWQTVAPLPALTAISPNSATAGSAGITLTLTGTGFTNRSRVRWNGQDRSTTFVSSTHVTAAIPASDLAAAGTARVEVVTGPVGGGTSGIQTFTIHAVTQPPPPGLQIAGATVQNKWKASRLRGRLVVSVNTSRAARLRVSVLRANGRGKALVTRTIAAAGAGTLTRRLLLKPTMVPGPYLMRVTEIGSGPGLLPRVDRRITVAAPREGVVSRAFFSTKIGGRAFTRIGGRSIIFAHFRFAARAKP